MCCTHIQSGWDTPHLFTTVLQRDFQRVHPSLLLLDEGLSVSGRWKRPIPIQKGKVGEEQEASQRKALGAMGGIGMTRQATLVEVILGGMLPVPQ